MFARLSETYSTVTAAAASISDRWLMGLIARLAFASVLLLYYWSSFLTKIGPGFSLADAAYYQIVPPVIEQAGYDVSMVPVFWKLVVHLGTLAEFLLPLLVILGVLTHLAALGMIGFIAVQSFVDIVFHGIGADAIGAAFDRFPDAAIADQRLLWMVPLVYLALKGAGALSVDALFARLRPSPALA